MEYTPARQLGEIIADRNIVLRGADVATAMGFTQVPNFLLKSSTLSSGDKVAFAMLLSYAWQNDFCFPGQARLAKDLGLTDRTVRTHLKSLEKNGLLRIKRRGLGKTNIYELDLKPPGFGRTDRKKTSALKRKGSSGTDRKRASDHLYKNMQ